MIRTFQNTDIQQVMDIWLNSNLDAHPFIPKEYWTSNYDMVTGQIAQAEVYVAETDGAIQGFIGLADTYIAGIFVDQTYRSMGIGTQLLEYAKARKDTLSLSVYQQNKRAVDFYLREGFSVNSESLDEETGAIEYTMCWKKQ